MKILVVGSGGREHALAWKLAQSPLVDAIYCAPGNAGIAKVAQCIPLAPEDLNGLLDFALQKNIDLTVVGPEAPLALGITDLFESHGLKVFGPTKAAAQLECSKAFAKEMMARYQIPTAAYRTFTDAADAEAYVKAHTMPVVIKANGLAAGKGVFIAVSQQEACAAIKRMLSDKDFGEAGEEIVIEDFLQGQEVSVLAFTDGKRVLPLLAAQDHKRAADGDMGPNTGGMGAYAPAPVIETIGIEWVTEHILQPTIDGMAEAGCSYKGVLYAGLMLTPQGPKVLEYNVRFGDPETQPLLALLENDLAEVLLAVAEGDISRIQLRYKEGAAVTVIMAAGGYPDHYLKGNVISGLDQPTDALVFHAGTLEKDGQIVTNGGRVLAVTALGKDIAQARQKAYDACRNISWTGAFYRTDIANKALS